MGAHGARHRDRLRGADAVGRQPAAAGLRQRHDARERARRLRLARPWREHRHRCATPTETRKLALLDQLLQRAARRPRSRPRALLRALAALADETLRALWRDAGMPAGVALVAVGGYGRGELFPLFRRRRAGAAARRHAPADDRPRSAAIEALHQPLLGRRPRDRLQRAHASPNAWPRPPSDVTVQTSLLESRLSPAREAVHARFQQALPRGHGPAGLLAAKTLEMRQRHQKFENTPYALEPNCKESPGRPARPADVILWVARPRASAAAGTSSPRNGLATPSRSAAQRNEALLSLIRARLHVIAGRREDRLVFDLQTAVAETFG